MKVSLIEVCGRRFLHDLYQGMCDVHSAFAETIQQSL